MLSDLANRLYLRSPVWIQNLLLSTYGRVLRSRRYGGIHEPHLAWLRETERLTRAEIRQLQLDLLNTQLATARRVPLYDGRGLPPELASLDELAGLPTLTKDDLRRPRSELVDRDAPESALLEIHTGGTTGKPLSIHCTRTVLQRNYAFFERFKRWAGIGPRDRTATFAGRTIVAPDRTRPPFWRYNRAANTMLCSSYHLSEATIPAYVEALRRFRPHLIDSYPSSIQPIARYLLTAGISDLRPTAVITSSETLLPEVRSMIERAFGCPVFDHYGAAEMVALITQCEHGRYHPNPEFGIVELIRDGAPVRPGEAGEIVATGFINDVMPLIRYRTGDEAIQGEGECPCGRPFPVVERIEGRMDDVLVTPEGRLVGRLDPIFKAVSSFYETRIVQTTPSRVQVQVVPAGGSLDPDDVDTLVKELRNRLGPSMEIEVVEKQELPRTASGKLRAVVNEVTGARGEAE